MNDPRPIPFRQALEHHQAGRLQEARIIYEKLLRDTPDDPNALHYLALIEHQTGNHARAAQMMTRSIALAPHVAEFHNNFGDVLRALGLLPAAQRSYETAINLRPDFAGALNQLGNVLRDLGDTQRSIDCFLNAVQLDPTFHLAHSNALLAMHSVDCDRKTLFEEHLRWASLHSLPDVPSTPLPAMPVHGRIRIGYFSADFYQHPVSFFIEPILAHHDRTKFEIFCYSNSAQSDETTRRIKASVDHWHDIHPLSDDQLADLVRQDQPHILIDLSGHTAGNRLVFLSRRRAQVQITYLGCADTTGLKTFDYRITDNTLDPPGSDEFYTEQLIRLSQWSCYRPPQSAPPVSERPISRNQAITFATSAKLDKLSERCLSVWRTILEKIPGSKLLVMSVPSDAPGVDDRVRSIFHAAGFSTDQIILSPRRAFDDYLAAHSQVDIMLDTFPFGGHTVTCHALWMGVPVVTLRGNTPVGRLGAEVLENVGLPELIAETEDQFVKIAVDLATDRNRLATLRQNLRGRMRQSRLMDAAAFTRVFEGCLAKVFIPSPCTQGEG